MDDVKIECDGELEAFIAQVGTIGMEEAYLDLYGGRTAPPRYVPTDAETVAQAPKALEPLTHGDEGPALDASEW